MGARLMLGARWWGKRSMEYSVEWSEEPGRVIVDPLGYAALGKNPAWLVSQSPLGIEPDPILPDWSSGWLWPVVEKSALEIADMFDWRSGLSEADPSKLARLASIDITRAASPTVEMWREAWDRLSNK